MKGPVSEDIIVIGGGLMGSATAYQLSRQGLRVRLLEQQSKKYTYGSSHGQARISRSLGPKDDIFSFLQQCSVKETKGLIEYLRQKDGTAAHSMDEIYRTSPLTYIYYQTQSDEVEKILKDQKDPIEFASDPKMAHELFGLTVHEDNLVIRENKAHSGTLNPRILIEKLHCATKLSGNTVDYGQRVLEVKKEGDHFKLKIEDRSTGEFKITICNKLVLAGGPYNINLTKSIAPYFKDLISLKYLFLSFIKIQKKIYGNLNKEQKSIINRSYPVIDFCPEFFYSMIETHDHDDVPIIKVGAHLLRNDFKDLDSVWKRKLTEEEINWSLKKTSRYLQMLSIPQISDGLEFIRGYTCVYSMTPSGVPYVTQIVEQQGRIDPNCILVGGMSGIGAKGALAYGLIASDILMGKERDSPMYQKARMAMGVERLQKEINN